MTWKGPFTIIDKRSDIDFVVDLGTREGTFHINLLKKYEKRESLPPTEHQAAAAVNTREGVENNDPPLLKQKETYENVKIATDLPVEQGDQAKDTMRAFQDIFSDVPGKTHLVECQLRLTTETPVHVRQYPVPFAVEKAIEEEIQEMLKQGIIEPSHSPYQSPVVVVKKKDGSMRLCIDFRQLNRVLITANEPIPWVDMMFAKLGKSRYFSKFDFTKGYWQVPMQPESKQMTAFQSASGLYQFRFMPFGIKTAPAVFTRLMRK